MKGTKKVPSSSLIDLFKDAYYDGIQLGAYENNESGPGFGGKPSLSLKYCFDM